MEGQEVEVPVRRNVGVGGVELIVLFHEIRLDGDLGLGEVEGLAPVVPLQHHLH